MRKEYEMVELMNTYLDTKKLATQKPITLYNHKRKREGK